MYLSNTEQNDLPRIKNVRNAEQVQLYCRKEHLPKLVNSGGGSSICSLGPISGIAIHASDRGGGRGWHATTFVTDPRKSHKNYYQSSHWRIFVLCNPRLYTEHK